MCVCVSVCVSVFVCVFVCVCVALSMHGLASGHATEYTPQIHSV